MKEIIVNDKYDNKKLNNVLLKVFPALNSNSIYKALRKKDIRINNVRVSENVTVHSGDSIKIFISDDVLLGVKNAPKITKIFEDENILVIDKPCGIESCGKDSISTFLEDMYSFIKPCHRLDMNTSGLMLFAKNQASLDILLDKFKTHEIEKHYLCRVYGIPKEKHKILNAYLFKDNKKSLVYISDEFKTGYQKIITSYTVINEFENNSSLLEVEIETGRTHQIRAHLAHIGYPIIGDGKYGINSVNKEFGFKYQQLTANQLTFNFKTDSGILNYINEKTFKLK